MEEETLKPPPAPSRSYMIACCLERIAEVKKKLSFKIHRSDANKESLQNLININLEILKKLGYDRKKDAH